MDNFIVSARKYRPATFTSVVGQSHITSTLKNAIARGQLAHAYLFCGPRGVGKTTCARIFAKAINCQNPTGSEACGECESCRSFNEGRSFNIHELDAASNNSVDDIRTLTEQVRIPPQVGRYSVYIIDEVHMLSQSAFNAFLKTLEEPPAHAVFILATTEKHKIIPTILSRCQIYDFNRIRVEDSVEYLKHIASQEGVTADDESLNLIAQKADGGMRDALSMFDKAVAFCGKELNFKEVARTLNVLDYDTYFTVTRLLGEGDYKGALTLFDEVLRKGFSGLTFISGLNSHFRDLLMCKDTGTLPLLEVTGSLLERYKQQSAEYDVGFLFNAIGLLSGVDNTFKSATNQRLHVELGLMKLCGSGQKKNELTPHDNGLTPQKAELPPLIKTTAAAAPQAGTSTEAPRPTKEQQEAQPPLPQKPETQQQEPSQSTVQGHEASQSAVQAHETPKTATPDTAQSATQHDVPNPDIVTSPPAVKPTPAKPSDNGGRSVTGISINDILKGTTTQKPDSEDGTPVYTAEKADPDAEQKISAAKGEFIEVLSAKRPRIATAFETMSVTGNTITLSVASEVLRDDIYNSQKEILGLLKRLSDTEGAIELQIGLKEDPTAVRPIRPEDKLAHLRAKNPLLDDLRRELNLEME